MAYMYLSSNNKYKGFVPLLHVTYFTSSYWKEIALKLNGLGHLPQIEDFEKFIQS